MNDFSQKNSITGLSASQAFQKRSFDLFFALLGLVVCWPVILLAWLLSTLDTRENGFFLQHRVGKNGRIFQVIKIRTMRSGVGEVTTVTTSKDSRITSLGGWFRRMKIDELPQLINVVFGQMSFVGPRPDVPGFADLLTGDELLVLSLRPGITGPATLKYRDEETLLAAQPDPEAYNRNVIWPDKVQINLEYLRHYSLAEDLRLIVETIFSNEGK